MVMLFFFTQQLDVDMLTLLWFHILVLYIFTVQSFIFSHNRLNCNKKKISLYILMVKMFDKMGKIKYLKKIYF